MATPNPTIQDVVSTRGLSRGGVMLSVGVVLDDGITAWGDCVYAKPEEANVARDAHLVTEQIKPLLVGKHPDSLPEILAALDECHYVVTRDVVVQPEAPQGISRRALLSALTADETPAPITKTVTTTHTLSAGLRYGVSQALVNAVARWRRLLPLTVVSSTYNFEARAATLPAHGELVGGNVRTVDRLVWEQVASIGFSPIVADAAKRWGYKGERLQGFVGQLRNKIVETCGDAPKPAIHLNLQHIYTELHDNQPGKVLGSLHGMRTAAQPCELRIVDPLATATEHDLTAWGKLKDFMRLRKYDSPLGVTIRSREQMAQFDGSLVDFIQIAPAEVGSLDQTIEIIRTAQAAGVDVYVTSVSAETPSSTELLTAIALATDAKQLLTTTDDARLHAHNHLQKLRITPR